MKRFELWDPLTGSSRIVVERTPHDRISIHATTDFGDAKCNFTEAQIHQLHNALGEILKGGK
jgi:hypothetical protein